jgi:hypothetical protein
MKTPKRTMTVKASQIAKAVGKARQLCPKDWQAEQLEILLIPKLYKRWRDVNDHIPGLELKRHAGFPWTGGRDEALAVEDWTAYAGYEMGYGLESYCWNRARSDDYAHSPASAWDGVRRETYHSFADNLRMAYGAALEGGEPNHRVVQALDRYKIRFINDLQERS